MILNVDYDTQHNNPSGLGYRECFSSTCAMMAKYHGVINTFNEYHAARPRFGDTTDSLAQIATLKYFGLKPHFVTTATAADLKEEIEVGKPVGVGWLHSGGVNNPYGGGHWSTVIGFDQSGFFVNDPNGEALLVSGGYSPSMDGSGLHYSYKNFLPRWEVEGRGSGWAMFVDK